MKIKSSKITIIVFAVLIFATTFLNLISKDKEFSETENRYLKQKPEFTVQNIISGRFTKDFEEYLNDQFVLRDLWISNKSAMQLKTLKKDINGVYIGKDGYLIEKCPEYKFETAQMLMNISYINELISYLDKNNIKSSVIVAPTASYILDDKLPASATNFDQKQKLDIIKEKIIDGKFVDVSGAFKRNKDGYIFYKTDHHWTSEGAFIAFQQWCKEIEKTVHNKKDYNVETVTESFRGSLYSKALLKNSAYDKINLYTSKNPVKYSVSYNFGKEKSNSIYNFDKLKEKDKYQVFFGGNYPEIKITTENKNGKNIVLFKDSYANSFVTFLLNDYESISIIDLRYFKGDVREYLSTANVTDVLVLYNIMNFSSDKNISKLGD